MAYFNDFWKDQWYNIMFFVVIMLNLIAIFSMLGINFKDDKITNLKKIVTIEAFGESDYSNGLCSTYASDPVTLEKKCNALSEKNCNITSCCGWLNKTSCVSGNKTGPNYHSKDGKNITITSWDFKK
jgi:hypothetical protein